ncbi:hypothetical protein B0T24DRAFT_712289 [Lasiosphaeria ovina]|uniref:Protein HGH1 C-terminal domain-containing protein n=1 Tax=Lasiosphaeria ovina TaxID=92902 RepID=A0AAE0JVM9_9PEZI|nr:hypothetical protein B0T24DRAFT_712289 [Lasiosphaeria ovina]
MAMLPDLQLLPPPDKQRDFIKLTDAIEEAVGDEAPLADVREGGVPLPCLAALDVVAARLLGLLLLLLLLLLGEGGVSWAAKLASRGEPYDEDVTTAMLPDLLQLLPPDKQRDSGPDIIIQTHVETLLFHKMLVVTMASRHYHLLLPVVAETRLAVTHLAGDLMRSISLYPIIRETHAHVDNEDVRNAYDRFVRPLLG